MIGAGPVSADAHRPAAAAIWAVGPCLRSGDEAFEHTLRDGIEVTELVLLSEIYLGATFFCLGVSMDMCLAQDDADLCLSDFAIWVRDARAGIMERLPAALDSDDTLRVNRYARALERARAPADEADCNHMTDAERVRSCEIVAEGMALEDAYFVWRMARREGAVDLEGHDPVDLELFR